MYGGLLSCLLIWLAVWLTDWLTHRLNDWLTDWLIVWLGWLTLSPSDSLSVWLAYSQNDSRADSPYKTIHPLTPCSTPWLNESLTRELGQWIGQGALTHTDSLSDSPFDWLSSESPSDSLTVGWIGDWFTDWTPHSDSLGDSLSDWLIDSFSDSPDWLSDSLIGCTVCA